MWKKIYDKLKLDGLNPYAPGQYEGLCTEPYVVVMEAEQMPSLNGHKLGQRVIDIILFVPVTSYVKMALYAQQVRESLVALKGLRKTGFETRAITDDDMKAYTMSIEYVLIKKLEG